MLFHRKRGGAAFIAYGCSEGIKKGTKIEI